MQYKHNLLFSFNTLQIRFSLFILFDEIRSNNYRNTLSGESIVRRLLVTVDEPERVHSIGKFEVRANNLDLWTFNLTKSENGLLSRISRIEILPDMNFQSENCNCSWVLCALCLLGYPVVSTTLEEIGV